LSYAKLPKEVVAKEVKAISKIQSFERREWQQRPPLFRARAPLRARVLFSPASARVMKSRE
jgi:hypothetical protein